MRHLHAGGRLRATISTPTTGMGGAFDPAPDTTLVYDSFGPYRILHVLPATGEGAWARFISPNRRSRCAARWRSKLSKARVGFDRDPFALQL